MPPRRIDRVDAQHELASAIAALGESRRDDRPRALLRFRRHGVFEIEDQPVGRQLPRFLQRPRVRAGHEKNTAARAKHGRYRHPWFADPYSAAFAAGDCQLFTTGNTSLANSRNEASALS